MCIHQRGNNCRAPGAARQRMPKRAGFSGREHRPQQCDRAGDECRREARPRTGSVPSVGGEADDSATRSSNAPSPRRPTEVRLIHWLPGEVVRDYRNDGGVPGDLRATEARLVAGGRDYQCATAGRMVKRLAEAHVHSGRRDARGRAQVHDSRAAFTHSTIASPTSSELAVGRSSSESASRKIGRTSSVHPGEIAGAADPLLATMMPATNVPWRHAPLSEREHAAPSRVTDWMFASARSGCVSRNRSVDQTYADLGAAVAQGHQLSEPDHL